MSDKTVFVVDDDEIVRDSLKALLESDGHSVRTFESARAVLSDPGLADAGCLVVDIRMPDMDGLTLQEELGRTQNGLPVIVVTGHGDVPLAVRAMKAGALDFLEKPFDGERMLDSVRRALVVRQQAHDRNEETRKAQSRVALLTARERQVLEHLVAGRPNKLIAYELDISPRTVEIHRARVMEKMQARSLSDVVRVALAAGVVSTIGL
ncbi:MAG: response regulator [Proteobacteria bacterium]|nr:response regulator [Pseudomonadota bacterium]